MSEKFPNHPLNRYEEKSPQEKLEDLIAAVEALKSKAHESIPTHIREQAIRDGEQRIQEFLGLHPELKKTWH